MKKVLTIVLVAVLVLSIGITAYATSADTDAKEVAGRFGFKSSGERLPVNKELMDELKSLSSDEQLALIESKLADEEITQEVYDRIRGLIENSSTFEPPTNEFRGRGLENIFDKESMEEFKALTTEEKLALIENKLEAEEITQEAYDRLKIAIENGFTFEPPAHNQDGKQGFNGRSFTKELIDELKDLTSEERLALIDSKLEAEEITQEAYDRLKVMIENGFTFEPPVHNQDGKQGFNGRRFTKELMDELKDLTSEERLALLDSKFEAEEITQEAYDRLKVAIENGFTFKPSMHEKGHEKLFDRELMDELKGLTSEEQLALLDSKLEAEEISQEAYDKLKVMIENGCYTLLKT